MNPIHPTSTYQNSIFYFKSIKSAYILNDILAKLILTITQSAPDTGRKGVGFGTVEGAQRGWTVQLINNYHAAALGLRAEGGIIHYQLSFARGHPALCSLSFISLEGWMATKQRARRRRAAYTLSDMLGDGDEAWPIVQAGFAIIDYDD